MIGVLNCILSPSLHLQQIINPNLAILYQQLLPDNKMSSSAPKVQSYAPEVVLASFKKPRDAVKFLNEDQILPLEDKCASALGALTFPPQGLSEEELKKLGDLHWQLVEEHVRIAKVCHLAPGKADNMFVRYNLHLRMWGHGMYDLFLKLHCNSKNTATKRFLRGYLDKCDDLMLELRMYMSDFEWAWLNIQEQIERIRPKPSI